MRGRGWEGGDGGSGENGKEGKKFSQLFSESENIFYDR